MISWAKGEIKTFINSFIIFAITCIFYFVISIDSTDFHYTYLLDDTYIHLAIAKNFAFHQIWGITSHEFSSTSSAPLFTLILSGLMRLFGNNEFLPLYFNSVIIVIGIYFLSKYFFKIFNNVQKSVIAVIFTLFFSVMQLHVLSGMEHVLQVILFILNIYCFSQLKSSKKYLFGFFSTLCLMGLVRFESMFYFVSLAFCFAILKQWKNVLGVVICGFLPIVVFCCINYQYDGYYFPNSVVVKGDQLVLDKTIFQQFFQILARKVIFNISFYKVGLFPLLMSFLILIKEWKVKSKDEFVHSNFLILVLIISFIGHSIFADLKGLFRYEAYLLVAFSMVLIPRIKWVFEKPLIGVKEHKLLSLFIVGNLFLLIYKMIYVHPILTLGGKNIYEQQVQSARFLQTYYNDSKIVANDIGAITYYTNIELFDIVGLGSTEAIPYSKRREGFDERFKSFMSNYSNKHNYSLAVVYEDWFDGQVPDEWKKVATLSVPDRITVYGKTVTIYCINLKEERLLRENLKKFKWNKNVEMKLVSTY